MSNKLLQLVRKTPQQQQGAMEAVAANCMAFQLTTSTATSERRRPYASSTMMMLPRTTIAPFLPSILGRQTRNDGSFGGDITITPASRRYFAKKKKGGGAKSGKSSDNNSKKKKREANAEDAEEVDDSAVEIELEIYEEEMSLVVEELEEELKRFRAGRATPEQIEDVKIKVYGAPTPVKSVGQISVRDAHNLVVTAHDPSTVPDIDAGLRNSDKLNVAAKIEGNRVIVTFPKATAESRNEIAKAVKVEIYIMFKAEKMKTRIRDVRHKALNEIKEAGLTKDDQFQLKNDVQKLTDAAIKRVEEAITKKTQEINTV
eukprot:jgi/Bigna1/141739/aug1.65_g16447